MSKLAFIIVLAFFALSSCSSWNSGQKSNSRGTASVGNDNTPVVFFSPNNGEEGFGQIYTAINNAKEFVYLTIYSWSDSELDKALERALSHKVKVRAVLHPDLKSSAKVVASVKKLEEMGAEFKIAPMNMHEKFTLIDDEILINTSANFSTGAKNKYSENIIFHKITTDLNDPMNSLIKDFRNEFTILWNSSKEIVTASEENATFETVYTKKVNEPTPNKDMSLYSSSMNWTTKDNPPTSAAYKNGRALALKAKTLPGEKEQTWTVRDIIINAIRHSKKSIFLSLNHFNIREVSDELIAAVKRGIDVRLAVDNQEYKSKPNGTEMTPQFVQDWYTLKGKNSSPPVRVKYYSHEPSPRYWLLNHHKYILVDYSDSNPENTYLLSGSYNLSRTAEQNQFDNLVLYKSGKYKELYDAFYKEFQMLWFWNRDKNGPRSEIYNLFFETKNNSYPIHINQAVSLTWEECGNLRSNINTKAPGIFKGLVQKKDCLYYDPVKKDYWGCPKE